MGNTNKQILSEVRETKKYIKKEIPVLIESVTDHKNKINNLENVTNNISVKVLELDQKLSKVNDTLSDYAYHYNTMVHPVLQSFQTPNIHKDYFLNNNVLDYGDQFKNPPPTLTSEYYYETEDQKK